MMKKNKTKKGYVLAIVIIFTFVMTVTIASTFTLIMRYMMFAKKDLNNFNKQNSNESAIIMIDEEAKLDA